MSTTTSTARCGAPRCGAKRKICWPLSPGSDALSPEPWSANCLSLALLAERRWAPWPGLRRLPANPASGLARPALAGADPLSAPLSSWPPRSQSDAIRSSRPSSSACSPEASRKWPPQSRSPTSSSPSSTPSSETKSHGKSLEPRHSAPQRLCLGSSDLPWLFVSEDGVEDGEELVGDRDCGGHFRLASGEQALEEGLEDRIASLCDLGGQEESGADSGSAPANAGLANPLAGFAGKRRKPGQGAHLLSAKSAKLRQFADHGSGDNASDPGDRGQQIFLFAPHRGAPHRAVDVVVDIAEFALEGNQDPLDALADPRQLAALQAHGLRDDHLDDLA